MEERTRKNRKLPWIIAGIVLLVLAAVYIGVAFYYQNRFLPGTTVNGISASGSTASEVEEKLVSVMDSYELTITGRNEIKDTITADEIDMVMDFGDSVEEAQEAQNEWAWPAAFFRNDELVLESALSYDEDLLAEKIASMNCMDEEQALAPEDAYISDYVEGEGFSIVAEVENNQLKEETFTEMVKEALASMSEEITLEQLEEADAYVHASVTSDDEELSAKLEEMNKVVSVTITYTFGSETETLTGDEIAEWLVVSDDGEISVDEDLAREYVNTLARAHDTYNGNGTREFATSYGTTVTVTGGDYGWWMDRVTTTEELVAAIEAGESTELTPVYYQTAASYSDPDYGDTYVEINLTAQHLFLYVDGELILETDFVSGNPSLTSTPEGVYGITYKERAHTMTGDDYRVETSYWMPFNGNIGMHDATWRSVFGGTIYKTNGSHGCINLPYYATRTIYQYVEKGTPVICYHLSGTESSTTTEQSDEEIATIGIEAIERIGTVSAETYSTVKTKIEWARQVYTDLSTSQRALVTNYQTLLDAESALKELE